MCLTDRDHIRCLGEAGGIVVNYGPVWDVGTIGNPIGSGGVAIQEGQTCAARSRDRGPGLTYKGTLGIFFQCPDR